MRGETMYSLDDYVSDLRRITAKTSDYADIFDRVAPLASKLALAKDAWLKPEHYEINEEQGFGVQLLHEEEDHSLAVFTVAWAPHDGTPPMITAPGRWSPGSMASSATSSTTD